MDVMRDNGGTRPSTADYSRYANLTFDRFRELALDPNSSRYEKIGFPDSYRQGYEEAIFQDICGKLTNLHQHSKIVLDVGPGCSELPRLLIDHCGTQSHTLLLCDSAEMLSTLPDEPFTTKIPGRFPTETQEFFAPFASRIDVLLCYSVLHHIFVERPLFEFLDCSLALLAPRGQMLLGDVPNLSKRKRFFASASGVEHHRRFTGTDETPQVAFNQLEPGKLDDSVMLAIIAHCRASGFDAYVVPQGTDLPMANRREDLLIVRP